MNITGGQVTFKRNFQPEQYGSKGAEVTIMFVMGDGEELGASLDKVGELVKTKVYELCNLKIEARAIATPADVKAADLPKGDDLGGVSKGGTKEAAAANMTAAEKRAATNAAKKKAEEDAAAAEAAKKPKVDTAKPAGDDGLGLDEFNEDDAGTAPEVSDADLSAANNRAVARLKEKHQGAAPQLIRELIATFVKPPLKTHDIPQNLRSQYLKKLEALV